jgi:hypothetical protein
MVEEKDVTNPIVTKARKAKQISVKDMVEEKDVLIVSIGLILVAVQTNMMDIVPLVSSAFFHSMNEVK